MYTLTRIIEALKKLPEEIISYQDCTISYRELPVLVGYSLESSWSTSATESYLESIGYSTSSMRSREDARLWALQTIYLKECTPPPVIFKNKNLRLSALRRLQYFKHKHSSNYDSPIMQYIITSITQNWNFLSSTTKETLSDFFNESGVFDPSVTKSILSPTGESSYQSIRLNLYKECNYFISLHIGTHYIPKDSPRILRESLKFTDSAEEELMSFSSEEWAWFTSYFEKCTNCNTWTIKSQTMFGYCFNCVPFPSELANYTSKATDTFSELIGKSSKYSTHLLGIELEYEQQQQSNQQEILFLLAKELGNHAIFKRDGSLQKGVEICTRPASLDIHLKEFNNFFNNEKIWERLEVKSTCGMHVHIDRRKMTALTLGKLITFMQQEYNKEFLEVIAGRKSNTFAVLGDNLSITSQHRGIASTSRYRGLNVCNQHTAEIRIFRTPNNFDVFLKNMEFVSALTSFVQPANSGIKHTNYESFLKYINDNRSIYKSLAKFTKETF